jgi:hypothetical protein
METSYLAALRLGAIQPFRSLGGRASRLRCSAPPALRFPPAVLPIGRHGRQRNRLLPCSESLVAERRRARCDLIEVPCGARNHKTQDHDRIIASTAPHARAVVCCWPFFGGLADVGLSQISVCIKKLHQILSILLNTGAYTQRRLLQAHIVNTTVNQNRSNT